MRWRRVFALPGAVALNVVSLPLTVVFLVWGTAIKNSQNLARILNEWVGE